MKKWSSFTVKSPTEIVHHSSHPMEHDRTCIDSRSSHRRKWRVIILILTLDLAMASKSDTNTRAIFCLAAKKPPYCLYGNPFYDHASHGNVFSTDENGGLLENIQNYPYSPKTGIHGMVFDQSETYLYSADLRANKIWTHKKDHETGKLELVGELDAPDPGDHPRWVELSPSGHYLYVLMEAGNRLGVYVIDEKTHLPVFTQITYPLVPPGK